MARMTPREMLEALGEAARAGRLDPVDFLQENFLLEGSNFLIRKPIRFEAWQVENVLRPVFERRKTGLDTFLNGLAKKNGKSTMGSCVATYALLLDDPAPEVLGAAGDLDQARIVFETTKKAFERSPGLRPFVTFYRDTIERVDGAGIYKALPADASGSHGCNASCVIWDELWNQPSYALWEALVHSPTRDAAFHFVVTYAGYQARSGNLLWDIYARGLAGNDPHMHTYWRSGADANPASWITPAYLESEKLRLPEHIYRRLHLNEWSIDEATKVFRIPAECWTGAFEDFIPGSSGPYSYAVGIDLAKVRDYTSWSIIRTDVEPKRLVDCGKLPHIDYSRQVDILKEKLARFDNPRALVDVGAAGTAVIELMRDSGMRVEPFQFTNESKARIVTDLAMAFEGRKLLLPSAGRTLDESRAVHDLEMELFNFQPTVLRSGNIRYEAAGGYFDDMVMALALGWSGASVRRRDPHITILDLSGPRVVAGKDFYSSLGPHDFRLERWWSK